MSDKPNMIWAIHEALGAAQIEYTAYSCNGVNLIGDRASIDKAVSAFNYASQIDWYQRNLRHWREECGKLHAQISALKDRTGRTEVNATYTIERDLEPIMRGDVPLPNPEPIEGDLAATILYYNSIQSGRCALLPGETQKKWNVSFFLDKGQGGQLEGSGIVAWTMWDHAKRSTGASGLRFAICKHTKVDGAGANHSRGWHPGKCSKCGLDMTVDSGD